MDIYSLRGNQWVEISSEELVPGDVISLKAEVLKKKRRNIRRDADDDYKEDTVAVVPCDALILRGIVHMYILVHTYVRIVVLQFSTYFI